jgi:hypothetical protein
MTSDQDITRVVRAWLQHDISESPDRVLASVLARLDTTPQRSRLRPVGGARSRYLRLAAAAALFVAAGGGIAALVGTSPDTTRPTPTPWQPPASLVTEHVEPGVERVLSDGQRDLSWDSGLLGYRGGDGEIVVGRDGSIWNVGPFSPRASECRNEPCAFYRIGDPRTHDRAPGAEGLAGGGYAHEPGMFEVAPDGTVWAGVDSATGPVLYSYDGETWTPRWTPPAMTHLTGLAIGADGTVWATWPEGVVRLRGEADVQERSFDADVKLGQGPTPLASSPDGRFVLIRVGNEIMRLGGPADEIVTEPFAVLGPDLECPKVVVWYAGAGTCGREDAGPPILKVGDDGTVVYEEEDYQVGRMWRGRLGRDDDIIGSGGVAWGLVPQSCPSARVVGVGPDGAVWMAAHSDAGRCGLIRWQASEGARVYLEDYAIASVAIAPDGSAWVHAYPSDTPDTGNPPVDVFVVRPDQAGDPE